VYPATAWDTVETTYTKPLLILVDAMSASMGEVFPAILQDPGRALVFGERTMGAGGNVVPVGPLGTSDILVTVTESLIWRSRKVALADGTTTRYLENIGIIPDYPYEITLEDFLFGFEGYRAAIERALTSMIDAQSFNSR
jgi:C-terminal processing protease CtpA/Prc